MTAGAPPEVGFVLRHKEDDPFRVNRTNQQALARAAARAGFATTVLDPSRPEFESAAAHWRRQARRPVLFCWGKTLDRLPDAVADVPVLCRDGNPPWYGSAAVNYRERAGKVLLHIDHDILDYASALNRAPVRPAAEFWCDAGDMAGAETPTSRRTILFVAAFTAIDSARLAANEARLAAMPRPVRDFAAAIMEEARGTFRRPLPEIAADLRPRLLPEARPTGATVRAILEYCCMRFSHEEKHELAAAAREFPGIIVTPHDRERIPAHPETRFLPPMPFPRLLELFAQARSVLAHLPQRMTGALSERFHNAGIRGAFTILPRSNAVARRPDLEPYLLPFEPGAAAVPEHLARLRDDPGSFEAMQEPLRRTTRETYSPDRAITAMLAHAPR